MKKLKVITLCGSTRFRSEYEWVNRTLTLNGFIVVYGVLFGHQEDMDMNVKAKVNLDELNLRKIDISDEIFVVNPNGYISESTGKEIEYAKSHGKIVRYLVSE